MKLKKTTTKTLRFDFGFSLSRDMSSDMNEQHWTDNDAYSEAESGLPQIKFAGVSMFNKRPQLFSRPLVTLALCAAALYQRAPTTAAEHKCPSRRKKQPGSK